MLILRSLFRLALASVLFLTAQAALAQHDVGGGSTKDTAAPSGESTGRRSTTVKRTNRPTTSAVRRPRPPVRRGVTAEQLNAQGDELFKAEQYDDALEAYNKALQLKPIASAYYHIGWIYNDRDDYDQALSALQQAVRLNPNDAESYYELGYAYRNLKRSNEALSAYRQAIQVRGDYAEAYYQIGWMHNDQGQFAQAIDPLTTPRMVSPISDLATFTSIRQNNIRRPWKLIARACGSRPTTRPPFTISPGRPTS